MTDIEEQLRTDLHHLVDRQPAPIAPGFERVRQRVERRERVVRRQRTALGGVMVAFALVAGTLVVRGGDGNRTTAVSDTTPRTGAPGWQEIAPLVVLPRYGHVAVALDGDVLVFGGTQGSSDDGNAPGAARYDPVEGSWRQVAAPPQHPYAWALWTGSEVLAVSTSHGELELYDPTADRWTSAARSPFPDDSMTLNAVWTGDELLVVAQGEGYGDVSVAGYDPVSDRWSSPVDAPVYNEIDPFNTAVWTGHELLVVSTPGASGTDVPHLSVMRYSPGEGWSAVPAPPLAEPHKRARVFASWTGTELVVGGGWTWSDAALAMSHELVAENREATPAERDVLEGQPAMDVAAWDPVSETWRTLPDAPVPASGLSWRYTPPVIDREVVAFEVDPADDFHHQTGRLVLLDPATGVWRTTDRAPGGFRYEAPYTWTGTELIVVGGEPSDSHPPEPDPGAFSCCVPTADALSFTP